MFHFRTELENLAADGKLFASRRILECINPLYPRFESENLVLTFAFLRCDILEHLHSNGTLNPRGWAECKPTVNRMGMFLLLVCFI
jgi:hypothetical protein